MKKIKATGYTKTHPQRQTSTSKYTHIPRTTDMHSSNEYCGISVKFDGRFGLLTILEILWKGITLPKEGEEGGEEEEGEREGERESVQCLQPIHRSTLANLYKPSLRGRG